MKKLFSILLVLSICFSVCAGNAENDEATYIILPVSDEAANSETSHEANTSADVSENNFTIRGDITFGMTAKEVITREEARGMHFINDFSPYPRDSLYVPSDNKNPIVTNVSIFFDENGHLVEIIYVFDELFPSVKERDLDISQHDADFADAKILYNVMELTLEQKYGPGVESGFLINSYCNWELSNNDNVIFSCINRRLVPYMDGYIVIEHTIAYNGEAHLNAICYEYMIDEVYNEKLKKNDIQSFLNEIL